MKSDATIRNYKLEPVNAASSYETQTTGDRSEKPKLQGQLTSPEPTTSNEENKQVQVSIPVSRCVTMPSHVPMFPCHMPPYSHADIPSKFPHRNPGGPANVWVAWSVTNLSLDLTFSRDTHTVHTQKNKTEVDSSVYHSKSTGGSYSL